MKSYKVRSLSLLALGAALATGGLLTTARADTPAAAPPAETTKDKKGGRGGMAPKWMDDLNLTDAQKDQIKPILKDAAEKRKALREDTTSTPEQKRDKQKALRQDTNDKIKAILTDEQKKKFDEAMANERKNRKDKAADTPAANAPAAAPDAPKA